MRAIGRVALILSVLAATVYGQQPANKWLMLGEMNGVTYEVLDKGSSEVTAGKTTGVTRNALVTGEMVGYYVLTTWEVDCMKGSGKQTVVRMFDRSGEMIKEIEPASEMMVFPEKSFGGMALKVWCKNAPKMQLKDLKLTPRDGGGR